MNRMLQTCLHSPSSCNWKLPLIYLFNTQVQTHGCSSCRVPEIFQDNVKVSTNGNRCSGFRTFSTGKDCLGFSFRNLRFSTSRKQLQKISFNKALHEYLEIGMTPQIFDLASKKCVPCNSKDIRPMTEQAAMELIPKVPEWNLVNEDGTLKLNRSWKTKSFTKGLELFQLVGDIAEAEGHHPDLHLIGWNNVKIEIWTHSVGGLTENDFILAAKIDSLDLEHLLRRKAVK